MDNLHAEDAVWSAGSCLTLLEARPLRPLSFHHVHLHISACNVGKGVVVCTPQAFEDQPSVTRFWAYKPPSQIQTAATRTLTTRNVTCINTCISSLYIYINLRACIYIYIYLPTSTYLIIYLCQGTFIEVLATARDLTPKSSQALVFGQSSAHGAEGVTGIGVGTARRVLSLHRQLSRLPNYPGLFLIVYHQKKHTYIDLLVLLVFVAPLQW